MMRYLLYSFLLISLLFSGCGGKKERIVEIRPLPEKKKPYTQPAQIQEEPVQEIKPVRRKKVVAQHHARAPESPVKIITAEKVKKVLEFVRINNELYPVPAVWRGGRISEKSPAQSQMRQIPIEFTWNKSKLYVESRTCEAFVVMAEKAREEGIYLVAHSGFRSIGYQRRIFQKLMAKGRTWEDLVRYVAPPGYSEHVLGTVVDLYPSDWRFASTKEYAWLKENGIRYGFYETYPERSPRGFPWEAWHWRYISGDEPVDADLVEDPRLVLQAADENVHAEQQQ